MPPKNDNTELANRIQNGDYSEQKNGHEIYPAANGMNINISDQEGAGQMVKWLRGTNSMNQPLTPAESENQTNRTNIEIGSNTVPQQPAHGVGNPKYKSMGGNRPSLPIDERQSFNDKDYRNTENRKDYRYGPTDITSDFTAAIKNQDLIHRDANTTPSEIKHETPVERTNSGYDSTRKTTNPNRFDLEYGSDENTIADKARADARHQDEMRTYEKDHNDGMLARKPWSENGTNFMQNENALADKARADARHQDEMRTYEKDHNGGFTAKSLSREGSEALGIQDTLATLAKENARLTSEMEELRKQLTNLTQRFDDPEALQRALDPNRLVPLNPLEKVQNTLLDEEYKRQQDFAADVQNTSIGHDPLHPWNDTVLPGMESSAEPTTTNLENAEAGQERNRTNRNEKKNLLIAGVIGAGTGLVTGALVGATVATGTIAPIAGIVIIAGLGTKLVSEIKVVNLNKRIENLPEGAEKENLKKKAEKWGKVAKWTNRALAFLGGFGIGLTGGALLSKAFMGGKGLLNGGMSHTSGTSITGNGTESTSVKTSGDSIQTGYNVGSSNSTSTTTSSGSNFDSGLIKNGSVNLPGSAWDGNLATAPTGHLPGEALNSFNYAGGATNMGAVELNNALNQAHIAVNSLPTPTVHRLLNMYQANPSLNLTDALKALGVTTGA